MYLPTIPERANVVVIEAKDGLGHVNPRREIVPRPPVRLSAFAAVVWNGDFTATTAVVVVSG